MSDDRVLEAIQLLTAQAGDLRKHVLPEHKMSFTESIPEPPPPIRIFDEEILTYLQKETPKLTLQSVNECCVRLIEANKIKLVNTNAVRPLQNGHLYELRPTFITVETEDMKSVKSIISFLTAQKKFLKQPLRFSDWEVYNGLRGQMPLQTVHFQCYSLVMRGVLKILGGLEWLNEQADGVIYELQQEL